MTAVDRNESVCQVHPVSRLTGEGSSDENL